MELLCCFYAMQKVHYTDKNTNIFENMASSVTIYSKNILKSIYFPKTYFIYFSCQKIKIKNRFSFIYFDFFSKIDFQKKIELF